MKTTKLLVLAFALVLIVVGSAFATPLNVRPLTFGSGTTGESDMQEILDTVLGTGVLDAYSDQNEAAIWQQAEMDVASYRIVSITSVPGEFGVYSYADSSNRAFFDLSGGAASFGIKGDGSTYGDLVDGSGNDVTLTNFGPYFGFYWETDGGSIFFTEDELNGNTARALSYLVNDGTSVDLTSGNLASLTGTIKFTGDYGNGTAGGNNDWIIGFEDGSDGDFQDAVFYVEDVAPVPEPATILLFGAGLLGLAAYGRKKGFRRS